MNEALISLWKKVLSISPPTTNKDLWEEHVYIRETINKVSTGVSGSRNLRKDGDLDSFFTWATENGIMFEGVSIENSPYGFTLVARKNFAIDTKCVIVPRAALLSLDLTENDLFLKDFFERDEMLVSMDNVGLVIILAYEILKKNSRWNPFLRVLPNEIDTPLFYSLDQLQALKPSPVFEDALNFYRSAARQWVYFYLQMALRRKKKNANPVSPFTSGIFTPKNFTFEFYRWCVAVVSTRINMIPSLCRRKKDGSPKLIPALIPFADMGNHGFLPANPASLYFEDENVFLQLNREISADEEILIHYGPRTNSKFLLHNGFIPSTANPDDNFQLKIGMPRSTDLDEKVELLSAEGIQQERNNFYLFLLTPDPTKETLIESPLWKFVKILVKVNTDDPRDSNGNKKLARKFLKDRLEILRRGYGNLEEFPNNDKFNHGILSLKRAECGILEAYLSILEEMNADN